MSEEQKTPFPCVCKAKFPKLDVFGQLSDKTNKDELLSFLRAHGIEVEFAAINTTSPAVDPRPAEGVCVLKVVGVEQTAIIPFGMLFAVADGEQDFMIIHPQVFLTFYTPDDGIHADAQPADDGTHIDVQSAE